MAEIPVHKKSGFPWWGWVIALVAVLLVLWLAFGDQISNEVDAQTSITQPDSTVSLASNDSYDLAPGTVAAL